MKYEESKEILFSYGKNTQYKRVKHTVDTHCRYIMESTTGFATGTLRHLLRVKIPQNTDKSSGVHRAEYGKNRRRAIVSTAGKGTARNITTSLQTKWLGDGTEDHCFNPAIPQKVHKK